MQISGEVVTKWSKEKIIVSVSSKWFCTFLLGLALALSGSAQTSTPPADAPPASAEKPSTPPPAQEPAAPTWSVGPIDFSGLVDGYYSFNANHPASQINQLYNFNDSTNQFSLNMAKLGLSHTADPVGFQVDIGFGRAFEIFNHQPTTVDKASDTLRFLEQAYVSLKPAKAKGLEIDFGKFVTSAGAEVIETNGNWNYSRSLLFALAIPYYHFGLRTAIPIGKYFTGGFQVVNGWNNVGDNNSGKTIGFTGTFTTKKFSWSNNYYGGPENPNTSTGWRHLYDTTLLLTPSAKFSAYINFDYCQNRNFPFLPGAVPLSKWYGIAGALHWMPNSKWSFTPRAEWFKDRNGFATAVAQDLKEFTLTGEYKMVEGFLGRLEYRHDWSNMPFFDYGGTPASKKSQDTVTLGLLAFFGPKR
jgi:hypothetical protein